MFLASNDAAVFNRPDYRFTFRPPFTTVSRMERGVSMPSVMTLHRIADALGVEVQEFFAPEARATEKARALGDLVTLMKRRTPHEIRMVNELASVALGELDRHYVPKARPKRIPKNRPHRV